MDYEQAFTDFEKLELMAGKWGFLHKDFSKMYEYLLKRNIESAQTFIAWNKAKKRLYCAKVICYLSDDEKLLKKAKKFIRKKGGELIG